MATTETSPAATSEGYQLEGSLLEVCNCDTLCPCWIGDDPDNGYCQSVVAYNLTSGKIRGVDVSGLTLVGVVHIPGNILEGNWKQAVLVDDRASDEQADALLDCFSGKLGGPLADLASLVGERVSVERAKIDHSIVDGAGTLKVEGKVDCTMQPYRGPDGSITTLNNSIFSTVPGSPAYVARADHQKVDMPRDRPVGAGGQERDPVRLEDRLPGRMTRGLPRPILVGIAAAWAAAIAAQLAGAAALLHHDSLLADGGPPLAVAALLSLLAWQVMIAAMMLPSSLPLVRLYRARIGAGAAAAARDGGVPRRLRARVERRSGWPRSARTPALHAAVNSSSWLEQHDWWIGGSVLALAGAFQFTSLKDACLDKCRHPGQFLMRYYERGAGGGLRLGMRHGAFCVGCCWALMLVMFAAGVASLIWMALLTAVMIHEKTRPAGARAVPVTGVALLAAASVVLAYSAAAAAA